MVSLIIWMAAITASIGGLLITAAMKAPYLHMLISAIISIFFALFAIAEARRMRASGAGEALVASCNARSMGLIWVWAALALFATYSMVLSWKEWWHFFLACMVVAGLCLFFSATLKSDHAAGRTDPTLKLIGRYLTIAQVAGMAIAIVGLLVDRKMTRFLDPRHTDWPANNFFFFGAVALFAIGLNALLSSREDTAALTTGESRAT